MVHSLIKSQLSNDCTDSNVNAYLHNFEILKNSNFKVARIHYYIVADNVRYYLRGLLIQPIMQPIQFIEFQMSQSLARNYTF